MACPPLLLNMRGGMVGTAQERLCPPYGLLHQNGTGEGQFEYVEFVREIEFGKAEAAINLYACDATAPSEGAVRIWFAGKVYEAPFKLSAKSGNRGALPMSGPYWLWGSAKSRGLTKE